jgi:arylsulfatase A-like enzyme
MRLFALPIALLALTWLFQSSSSAPKPPNVVIFYMDDLGYGDLSCYGALQYSTPALDKMAAEGIRFTSFLSAQAVCTASRAGLLTGCYPNRIGLVGALFPNSPTGINTEEQTLAELFKAKNYRTGIFGKWHLGDKPAFLPLQHGFDEYFGIPYSNDMWPVWYDGTPAKEGQNKYQFPPLPLIDGNQKVEEVKTLAEQGQLTKRLTQRALSFIQKNKKQPFFLYFPNPMPHVPIAVSENFDQKTKQGLYADLMQEIDWSVAQILNTLKAQGLEKNTLVIFTSDNGPWFNFGNHAGSSGGFREGKGTTFEGGHRVPCIMRWPGVIPTGLVCNQLSSSIDLLPTLASLCNLDLPSKKIDGVNLLPLLKGNLDQQPRRYFYYYYRKNHLQAVRRDHWKLVLPHEGRSYLNQAPGIDGFPGKAPENIQFPMALYDLRRDPSEAYDVQQYNPQIVEELLKVAEEARADLGDEITNRKGTGTRPAGKIE